MLDGFLRVAALSPDIHVGHPKHNATAAARLLGEAAERGVRLAVMPELCLTGYTCGDLFLHGTLLREAEDALADFMEQTAALDALAVIGVPVAVGGVLYDCAAVTLGGVLLGLVPKTHFTRPDAFREERYFTPAPRTVRTVTFAGQTAPLGTDLLFTCREMPALSLAVELGADRYAPLPPSARHAAAGATLITSPCASPEGVTVADTRRLLVRAHTERLHTAYVLCEAGMGESGTDAVFGAHRLIARGGYIAAEAQPFADERILTAELDLDAVLADQRRFATVRPETADAYTAVPFSLTPTVTEICCPPPRFPFVPEDTCERERRCADILNMQARALAARMERAHAKTAVLGVSGGLDSTLALLVAARAADLLGRERTCVSAITMPCFGTTGRTRSNAERLAEALGTSLRCIDIQAAVARHFRDIGQREDAFDVVYENAQARERTQVLMDIANAEGGLVVGTGDLSELALGWATYNGDHMSMYAVNAAVPKTLLRHIVAYCAACAEARGEGETAAVLRDVLATPVSPELLPPKDGEIAQCTEGIVGPYELHDYFLYYTLRYGFSPDKLLRMATLSFRGVYDADTVRGWLAVFLRRYLAQQFKRSCLPDGPGIGSIGVSPRTSLCLPSDADAAWFSI